MGSALLQPARIVCVSSERFSLLHVSATLELYMSLYMHCLVIDFADASDLIDLLGKLKCRFILGRPNCGANWVISCLSGYTQVVRCNVRIFQSVQTPASFKDLVSVLCSTGILSWQMIYIELCRLRIS